MNVEEAVRLVLRLLPRVAFHRRERFFPIRAEAWLTHTTSAPWPLRSDGTPATPMDPDAPGSLAVDPRRRGTALMRMLADTLSMDTIEHVAGPPNVADRPLHLNATADPASIGNPAYRELNVQQQLFLNFGGWPTSATGEFAGDLGYLAAVFSELAAAMSGAVSWQPYRLQPNRPRFGRTQPPSPMVYCEIDVAGAQARAARRLGGDEPMPEDPAVAAFLDNYLQLTYHYFFPAREEPPDEPDEPRPDSDGPHREGQWAAIAVFLPVEFGPFAGAPDPDRTLVVNGDTLARIDDPAVMKDLFARAFVAISVDEPGLGLATTSVAEVHRLSDVVGPHNEFVAYAERGTHRFRAAVPPPPFAAPAIVLPANDAAWTPSDDGLLVALLAGGVIALSYGLATGILVGVGLEAIAEPLPGFVTGLAVGGTPALVVLIWLLLIILLLMFIEWILDVLSADPAPASISDPRPDATILTGPSPAELPGGSPPSPLAQPGVAGGIPVGLDAGNPDGVNQGLADGRAGVAFDVQIVYRLPDITDPGLAPPPWWTSPGGGAWRSHPAS